MVPHHPAQNDRSLASNPIRQRPIWHGATASPFFHSDKNRQRQKLTGGSLLCEGIFRRILTTNIDFGLLDMELENIPTALLLRLAFSD
jgi:hypothetical protein